MAIFLTDVALALLDPAFQPAIPGGIARKARLGDDVVGSRFEDDGDASVAYLPEALHGALEAPNGLR